MIHQCLLFFIFYYLFTFYKNNYNNYLCFL